MKASAKVPRTTSGAAGKAVPIGFLAATATVSGALIMVVEVMGSRVIGPFFGVSLFVWTALITVTLVALAAGYAFGGWLADRRGSPDTLYAILLLAGLAALAVPLLKSPVLRVLAPLGLRSGALLSSLVLFGPCLFLMGCVSPFVVRLAATALERIGRTVGMFYALSTVGSFVGTVVTGFFLIAWLGVRGIFFLTGGILVALAALWFVFFRRRWVALALCLVPFLLPAPETFTSLLMANGTRVTRIFRVEGFYGDVQVLEYSEGDATVREMVLDGLVQGGIDPASGLPVYDYAYFLQFLPWGMRPGGESCLVIGLGAGLVAGWYERQGAVCDSVDINPDVVAAAKQFFGFAPQGRVFVEDARRVLAQPGRQYDYVVLDAFTGDTTPGHLLTVEAIQQAKGRLAPGGVLSMNLIVSLQRDARMTASVVRTMQEVFDTVRLFPTFDPAEGLGIGNLVLVAHDGPPLSFDRARVASFPVHPMARPGVDRFLGLEHVLEGDASAIVLTDDYNPIDFFDRWLKEQIRWSILRNTEWQVLL